MLALQFSISGIAQVRAYAGFKVAPAVATANILSTIIGGVIKLPIAKTLNLWGRAEGLCASVAIYIVGMIILAACNGPSSYAAGYVLFLVGYDAIYLILQIFVADTSGLRNRAFTLSFALTPFICTAFTGPLAGNSFVEHTGGWRWAYGAFCIIMPFVFLPLAVAFKYYEKKGIKLGIYTQERSSRTVIQSIVHYWHQFDGMQYLSSFNKKRNTNMISCRCLDLDGWLGPPSPAIQFDKCRTSRLRKRHFHRHDCRWILHFILIRCLGEVLCPGTLYQL